MARQPLQTHLTSRYFKNVRRTALALPGVEVTTKYDGSPVVRHQGCFVAGLAAHPSAEPDTLVVRYGMDDREWLVDEAPEIFYLTDYYRPYPLILVRLARVSRDALHDLLRVSLRITEQKARGRKGHGKR